MWQKLLYCHHKTIMITSYLRIFVTTFSKSKTVSIIFLEKNVEMLFEAGKSFMFMEEGGGGVSSQVV